MKINRYILLATLMNVAFSSCKKEETTAATDEHAEESNSVEFTQAQMKTADVQFGKVEQKQISGTIKANGVLDVPPQQKISISVPLGGFLKSTKLLQGTRVKKGEIIAVIENPDYIQTQQDYLEAKNQLEFAEADYQRQQELAKENVNAQKTVQQAKSSYQSWLVKKSALEAKLKLININSETIAAGNISSTANVYSPITGYVVQVNVNIGKYVNPTDVLFEIVDTEHLHAELTIFEKDITRIKIGQKVRFTLANETSERTATVHLIGREIAADRSVRIHCHIDNEDPQLLPGMYLRAVVETSGASVSALPEDAIVDFQGKKYVFVSGEDQHEQENGDHHEEEGTHFQMIEVTIGDSELGYTEVTLPEEFKDSQVVVKGAYALLSKIKNSEEEGHAH